MLVYGKCECFLKITGFIPSGHRDLFSSFMYPVMLTLPTLSKCLCKIVDMCVFSSWNCAIASIS